MQALRESEQTRRSFGQSLASLFGVSNRDQKVNYDRESFKIRKEDGWSLVDRSFHNYWAPMTYKARFPILFFTFGVIILAGIASVLNVGENRQAPITTPGDLVILTNGPNFSATRFARRFGRNCGEGALFFS
jgi:hypothetical protein